MLGLLLLLNLLSGLLHPCCLAGSGSADASVHGGHAGAMHGLRAEASPAVGTHHAGATAEHPVDAHHGPVADGALDGGGDTSDEDGCGGACALCCSTVDQAAIAAARVFDGVTFEGTRTEGVRLADGVIPPATPFLLPLATAPPGSPALFG